jgi:hypothetical protein
MTGMIVRATGAAVFYIIVVPICDKNTMKNELDVPAGTPHEEVTVNCSFIKYLFINLLGASCPAKLKLAKPCSCGGANLQISGFLLLMSHQRTFFQHSLAGVCAQ